jgi:hypothetical protein
MLQDLHPPFVQHCTLSTIFAIFLRAVELDMSRRISSANSRSLQTQVFDEGMHPSKACVDHRDGKQDHKGGCAALNYNFRLQET